MTSRLRITIVVAILLALGGHLFAHAVVKECPCVHVAAVVFERADTFVLPLLRGHVEAAVEMAAAGPECSTRTSRAPPAA